MAAIQITKLSQGIVIKVVPLASMIRPEKTVIQNSVDLNPHDGMSVDVVEKNVIANLNHRCLAARPLRRYSARVVMSRGHGWVGLVQRFQNGAQALAEGPAVDCYLFDLIAVGIGL